MEFQTSKVTVDGKTVLEVRELSAKGRQSLYKLHDTKTDAITIQAHIVKMGCPEYADKSIDDILEIPGRALDAISREVITISGLGEDTAKKAKKN